jgi:tRNA C32,U32 (ribose-2'-O)-methylase TrmJ
MVIAYELFTAAVVPAVPLQRELPVARELDNFYAHLQTTLEKIGFLDPDNRDRMMFSLRQIFGRGLHDARDLSILRGILSSVARVIK